MELLSEYTNARGYDPTTRTLRLSSRWIAFLLDILRGRVAMERPLLQGMEALFAALSAARKSGESVTLTDGQQQAEVTHSDVGKIKDTILALLMVEIKRGIEKITKSEEGFEEAALYFNLLFVIKKEGQFLKKLGGKIDIAELKDRFVETFFSKKPTWEEIRFLLPFKRSEEAKCFEDFILMYLARAFPCLIKARGSWVLLQKRLENFEEEYYHLAIPLLHREKAKMAIDLSQSDYLFTLHRFPKEGGWSTLPPIEMFFEEGLGMRSLLVDPSNSSKEAGWILSIPSETLLAIKIPPSLKQATGDPYSDLYRFLQKQAVITAYLYERRKERETPEYRDFVRDWEKVREEFLNSWPMEDRAFLRSYIFDQWPTVTDILLASERGLVLASQMGHENREVLHLLLDSRYWPKPIGFFLPHSFLARMPSDEREAMWSYLDRHRLTLFLG